MALSKRTVSMDMPAAVLIELVKDPKGYERKLIEIDQRTKAAEEAEARWLSAEETARKAEKVWDTKAKTVTAAEEVHERQAADEEAGWAARKEELDNEDTRLRNWDAALAAKDSTLNRAAELQENLHADLDADLAKVKSREKEVREAGAAVNALALAIAAREAKFANRLKEFNDGLDEA